MYVGTGTYSSYSQLQLTPQLVILVLQSESKIPRCNVSSWQPNPLVRSHIVERVYRDSVASLKAKLAVRRSEDRSRIILDKHRRRALQKNLSEVEPASRIDRRRRWRVLRA